MIKNKCNKCNQGFRTLTDEKLCYYCYFYKHKTPPKTGVYKEGK